MSTISVRHDDAVVTLTLNRPDKLNALTQELLRDLLDSIRTIAEDPTVRVAVLTGAGERAFAAGADIAAMSRMTTAEARNLSALGHCVGSAIEDARVPFIAQINGFALGGGCELAMCCDILYASDKAKLGQPEVNLGIMPGFGGTQRLARRVGLGRARELCMTGELIGAEEALRIGLVDGVASAQELPARVHALATKIAEKAPLAVAAIKRAIGRGQDVPLHVANELEAASFSSLFGTADQREGMQAFLEKRPPKFVGT
jgi:enoyl-CoA hydratase